MEEKENTARAIRKSFQGVVVSEKMDKTRVVTVDRVVKHTFYGKVMRKATKFYAHDEGNESHKGDLVEIVSTRPISRLKRWRVARIVEKAR